MNAWLLGGMLTVGVSMSDVEVAELSLDFNFPTAQVVENIGSVNAVAVNPEGGVAVLIDNRSQMFFVTLEGELLEQQTLRTRTRIAGAEWTTENDILLLTRRGRVLNFNLPTRKLTYYASLPKRLKFQSIAASSDGTLYGINNRGPKHLLQKRPGKGPSYKSLDPRLNRYRVSGLHAFGDSLYATAQVSRKNNSSALILKISMSGDLLGVWEIDGRPTGLSVLEESDNGPELLTINRDTDASIKFYEPQPDPSDVDQPVLPLLSSFVLGSESINQPSGSTYWTLDQKLYFVTDFGVVARSDRNGEQVESLFQIPDTMQGDYEAIAVKESGNVTVLASDDAIQSTSLFTYDVFGNLVARQDILVDEDVVIEAFALDAVTQSSWWIEQPENQPTSLKTVSLDGVSRSLPLPASYSALTFTGLELANGLAFMVTEEQEVEDRRLAGLLIVWDIARRVEVGRFSIGAPDEDGLMFGVRDPSSVAVDWDNRSIYVTSDTDEGNVYCYDFRDLTEPPVGKK